MITNKNLKGFKPTKTSDGYHFVNHALKLMTCGFSKRKNLLKYEMDLRFDAGTIKIMTDRYNKEFQY